MTITNYSHSRLGKFEQCKLAYKFQYIDKIKTEFTNANGFLGSRVHDALHFLHINDDMGRRLSLDETLNFFNTNWQEMWNENVHVIEDNLTQEHFRARGERYIREYYEQFSNGSQSGEYTVSLEERRLMDLPDGNRFHIRIDRLSCKGGNFIINDYKTSRTLMSLTEAHTDRQLGMYALWVYANYPEAERVVQRWYLLHFNKTLEVNLSRERLEGIRNEVIDLITEIEQCEDYPSKKTFLCDYCEYRDICPEFSEKKPEIIVSADAVAVANELVKLRAENKKIENRIKSLENDIRNYHVRSGATEIRINTHVIIVRDQETIELPDNYTAFLHENQLLDKYGQVSFSKVKNAVLSGVAEPVIVNTVKRLVEKKINIKRLEKEDV